MNAALQVQDLSHWFGANRVLNHVNFEVPAGQIVALVGPSGCGKSTLLRAILGTHPPRAGRVLADGKLISKPSRHVGIVYQHYSLYDFLTARDNVAFGLKLDGTGFLYRVFNYLSWRRLRKGHLERADQLLAKVQLSRAADLYPSQMSGGMRQRVAIAQALIMEPSILLLDEPFGALDEATREELQLLLLRLYEETPYTILIVTHELNEALYVSDRVLGLSQYHADGANGATIVYDKPAPVFKSRDPRDFSQFEEQKEEIRRTVFDPEASQQHRRLEKYWEQHPQQPSQASVGRT
jgi:ABC-type nitrate/sulfonate/bicarbonate transport system ATPase subunit